MGWVVNEKPNGIRAAAVGARVCCYGSHDPDLPATVAAQTDQYSQDWSLKWNP
jgi:hypothetical protein